MALHKEVLEDRFNYTWVSEPIYLGLHQALWIPGDVEPEEASATEILTDRLLGIVAGSYNTTLDILEFTVTATLNNTTGSSVAFNRVTIWRGVDAIVGSLGDGTVGNTGLEITLISTPPASVVNGSRVLLSNGTTYLQATVSNVSGSVLTLSTTVSGSFSDGVVVKVVGGMGQFVGNSQLSFDATVNDAQTVDITISGSNLTQ